MDYRCHVNTFRRHKKKRRLKKLHPAWIPMVRQVGSSWGRLWCQRKIKPKNTTWEKSFTLFERPPSDLPLKPWDILVRPVRDIQLNVHVHIQSSNSHIIDQGASIFAEYTTTKQIKFSLSCAFFPTAKYFSVEEFNHEPGRVHCGSTDVRESHEKLAICPLVGHFGSPADPPLTFHWNVKELSWFLI